MASIIYFIRREHEQGRHFLLNEALLLHLNCGRLLHCRFPFMERKSKGRSRAGFLSIQSKVLVLFKTCNCEATLFGVTSGSKSIFKILSETLFEVKTPINSHCKRDNWLKRGLLRLFGTNNKSVALSFTTHHLLVEGFRECFQCSQPRVS